MRTSIPFRLWTSQPLCRRTIHTTSVSCNVETYGSRSSVTSPTQTVQSPTFEAAGIRAPIASALRKAFPNIKHPTDAQNNFIPAILNGSDVMLKDATGTGKSFGVIVSLLSKARKQTYPSQDGKRFVTSLVIASHKDLAYQFHHWIERLVQASQNNPPPLSSIAQVIARGSGPPISEQISSVIADPPHILIGTPNSLMDLFWSDDTESRRLLRGISSVYVDEVDYLIESIPQHAPKDKVEKMRKRMRRHPGATNKLLDLLFASRHRKWSGNERTVDSSPQLIMSSATLHAALSKRVLNGQGWIDRHNLVKVAGGGRKPSSSEVQHCVLCISKDGEIRNIEGAQKAVSTDESREMDADEIYPETTAEMFYAEEEETLEPSAKLAPLDHNALEAIAAAFALDVPSVALLSLHSAAPVRRIVQELRELGVNAQSIDLLLADKGRAHLLHGTPIGTEENPVMLVSTVATTRGIDLPNLTHVFTIGVPYDGHRVNTYRHIAGRVGRFGRGGKVITIVNDKEEVKGEDGSVLYVRDEPKRMLMILKDIGVLQPTEFEHFSSST